MSVSWPHPHLSFTWLKNVLKPQTFASYLSAHSICSGQDEVVGANTFLVVDMFHCQCKVLFPNCQSRLMVLWTPSELRSFQLAGVDLQHARKERTRCLSWWEKGKKKRLVLHSCKTGILDSLRHFCTSVWMVASLDTVKIWMNFSSFLNPPCMATSGKMQAGLSLVVWERNWSKSEVSLSTYQSSAMNLQCERCNEGEPKEDLGKGKVALQKQSRGGVTSKGNPRVRSTSKGKSSLGSLLQIILK